MTNLMSHLRHKHPSEYSTFRSSASASRCDSQKKVEGSDGNGELGSDDNDDTMVIPEYRSRQDPLFVITSTSSSKEPPLTVQLVKKPSLPKKLRLGDKETIEIDKCLVKLIAYDLQPFTIVDDVGFKEFVHALNPDYDLPSRNTISSSLLPANYEERKQYFMNFVRENAESVCLTVECWSSKTMDQYMGVTAHFFSEDLEMKSVFLQCDLLDGSDTGPRTAQQLKEIVEAWGISDKIVFLVTDNASNMCSASHILNWKRFGCFERKLNLVVQNALCTTAKEIIEKVTKTVTYLKNNSIGKDLLMKYQLNDQNVEQPRTVIEAISTRWNSTYLMLERFHSLKEAIQATVVPLDNSLPIISSKEWEYIKQMCLTLKPFYEVSNVMSGENHLTASTAMVLTSNLISICDSLSSKRDLYTPVSELLEKLREGLTQELGDIQYNINIAICTLLDPRYKDVAFPETLSLEQTKRYVLTLMQSLHTDDDTEENIDSDDVLSIWGEFDSKTTSSNAPKTAETKAREELDMFLKETVIHRKLCPLTWWRTNKNVYPVLYKIFKTKCNIVVTTVPCEQAFSETGFVLNDRRTCLTTSKVSQVMFLNVNKTN
nr:zinc finger BED domain-containing protein 4-like [Maniola hyperantus]